MNDTDDDESLDCYFPLGFGVVLAQTDVKKGWNEVESPRKRRWVGRETGPAISQLLSGLLGNLLVKVSSPLKHLEALVLK